MLAFVSWTCPYCLHRNRTGVDVESVQRAHRSFAHCDIEEGGCDKLVALEYTATVTARVHTLTLQEEDIHDEQTA